MERSVYAHMTRVSLAPMYDGFSVFVVTCVCVCTLPGECMEGQWCTGVCERCERESSK